MVERQTSEQDLFEVLKAVIDPELGADIVTLGMVPKAYIDEQNNAHIHISLTTLGCPLQAEIRRDVVARIEQLPDIRRVKVHWAELDPESKAAVMATARKLLAENPPSNEIPLNTKVVMVASGKGGVGKSSITTNLATAVAATGLSVGVLDADIWGFSVPRMLGIEGRLKGVASQPEKPQEGNVANAASESATAQMQDQNATDLEVGEVAAPEAGPTEGKIVPNQRRVGSGRLKVVSMGFLVEQEDSALMWRGLILNRAVRHFLEDVAWGDLDYLFIDMPPGTGDVQMGLAKMLPRAEVLIVTTPALAAQKVAARAASMGRKNYLKIAGVIENMTAFVAPDGQRYEIFGSGGGSDLAEKLNVELLGQVPIDSSVGRGGDMGEPAVLSDGPAAVELRRIAHDLVERVIPPADMGTCTVRIYESPVKIN